MANKQSELEPKYLDDKFGQQLISYIKAGYPLLVLVTPEEIRAELEIVNATEACNREVKIWSSTTGLVREGQAIDESTVDPIKAIKKVRSDGETAVYVFRDLHPFYKSPHLIRNLRDISREFKEKGKTIIILSPSKEIHKDLERDVVVLDFDLPDRSQIEELWSALYENQKAAITGAVQKAKHLKEVDWLEVQGVGGKMKVEITEDEQDRICTAALGLTMIEAENAFSKAIVHCFRSHLETDERPTISKLVMKEKANAVKKNGILEYFEPKEGIDDIGGLEVLKKWMDIRSKGFSKAAREFGLPSPKGILLVGLPGCGKSLTAKAASGILGVPFIRFDISRIFGGLVGQSEQQMRNALQTIERVGQCVVWIDEAEKAFAGAGGGGSNDSGVTRRVFGNFLTWMQEKSEGSFVVMTVNNIDAIAQSSPEMLRKGRFDELFFVGLPTQKEREQIFEIHIRKNGRDPSNFTLPKLAEATEGFSGAEIENLVIEGLYHAFYEGKELEDRHILKARECTKPLSETNSQALTNMATWADENAVNASAPADKGKKPKGQGGRRLEI